MARYVRGKVDAKTGWTPWVHPLNGYRIACCDCGLVHDFEFSLDDNHLLNIRARRNVRATAQCRRYINKRREEKC